MPTTTVCRSVWSDPSLHSVAVDPFAPDMHEVCVSDVIIESSMLFTHSTYVHIVNQDNLH